MKNKQTTIYIPVLLFALTMSLCLSAQSRKIINLNYGWDFSYDEQFSDARKVDIPHDFQIEQAWIAPAADEKADNTDVAANQKSRLSARGFKEMGTGWYRRIININEEQLKGRRVLLDFEGIMLVGDVFLNGKHIGGTDYGYIGFDIDITNYLHSGDNELMVKASTMTEKNSRWYTGGGLFRNVNLITTSANLYLERHPLYITTRQNRFVTVGVEFTNRTKQKEAKVGLKIYDPNGLLIYETSETAKRQTTSRTQEYRMKEIEVSNPQLWDTEHPNLYRAEVTLMQTDGTVTDSYSEDFGLRSIEFCPEFGMKLNGKKVLLKGFANHHTLGALGAAAYPRAIEKRLLLMKQFGINHVRTSHNPYSRDFIKLCDKLGILVVDELYDKWTQQHTGGRVPFMNHWAQDVTEWVKRDRNSPSVVLWSLGNELQQDAHQPFNDFGVTCYNMMKTVLHRYDSTRLVTVAMHPRYRNWETDSLPCDLALQTDIQAYNYRYMYFPGDGKRYPWMTFYQSEASTAAMGPNYFEMDLNKVIGLAYWGAIDYLGESQGWPAKGWAQGVFDISLAPKPKAYLMKSLFTEEPVVRVSVLENKSTGTEWNGIITGNDLQSESWNRPAHSKVNLIVYTNGDEAELLLNGKSIGRKQNPTDTKNRNQIIWTNVEYQQGILEARAYRNNRVVARHTLETTGKAVKIIAETDNRHWKADGMDLQHIRLTAVDAKGRQITTCDDELSFQMDGDARIIAVTNGDINSSELNVTNHRQLWQGAAMVILRAGQKPSKIILTTQSSHFKPVITKLETE